MNLLLNRIVTLYSKFLLLYPGRFRDEFAEEMRVVFKDSLNEAVKDGILPLTLLCLRELIGLPHNILQEFWHEAETKKTVMATNENTGSIIGEEMNRWVLKIAGVALAFVAFAWFYTSAQLTSAGAKGVYSSPEQGMQAIADKMYSADRDVRILYAGTDSFDGSQPHVWYVIAEVRASSRADGSSLKYHGCESPGLGFIQTREGWVQVPDFPLEFIGFWMKVFDWAGEGQSIPSTDWGGEWPIKFCQ